MKQDILIIRGNNSDEFFIMSNRIINDINNQIFKGESNYEDLNFNLIQIDRNNYKTKNQMLHIIEDIDRAMGRPCLQVADLVERFQYVNLNNLVIYMRVEHNSALEYDVTPLRYFSIMRRKYENILLGICNIDSDDIANQKRIAGYMFSDSLCEMNEWEAKWITPDNENKKISLSITSTSRDNNKFYNQIFLVNDNISRLPIHGIGIQNKIIPCMYLDMAWFEILTNRINCYITNFDNLKEDYQQVNRDYIYRIQRKINNYELPIYEKEIFVNNFSKTEWKYIFYEVIVREISIDNLKDGKVLNKNNCKEIYNLCSDMSMLSFLLFSSFCNFIYKTKKNRFELFELKNLAQSAQDFSEALVQLIENALEYSQGASFSFRIHKGDNINLLNKYNCLTFNDEVYYLEVLLTDYNTGGNLTQKFIEGLEKRCNEGELPEDLVQDIKKNITLSGFFHPNEGMQTLWDKYYQIANNVTNHYGLLLFDALVNFYRGYFLVSSVTNHFSDGCTYECDYSIDGRKKGMKTSQIREIEHVIFPGTQYSILLPIKRYHEQKRVGIHLRPQYNDIALKNKWENKPLSIAEIVEPITRTKDYIFHTDKSKYIQQYAQRLQSYYDLEKVYVVKVDKTINDFEIEIFAKAMITFILNNNSSELRIAIINANNNFLVGFVRFFAIFYNKRGKCNAMEKVQLFLCDNELRTEIIFSGESLNVTYANNEIWANAKGEYNDCLETLQIVLNQRIEKFDSRKRKISFVPFDILVQQNNDTLFEKRVYKDLMSDIQKENFGCCLNNIHMRVGSKMHITDHFFETFQLFNSSLYNSRFAYLVASEIMKKIEFDGIKKDEPIILVGYDTYSELLMLEIQACLKESYSRSVRVIIFEQAPHPNFRMWKDTMKNGKFIIIVPTSTTLTTHEKIAVELEKKLGGQNSRLIQEKILLNIAVILIRDSSKKKKTGCVADIKKVNNLSEIESNYWYLIDEQKKEVITKSKYCSSILYNVLVESKWQEPLSCKCCYPKTSLIYEKPIIEVNRASVVPMIMAGPRESSLERDDKYQVPSGNLNILKNVMCYGHGKRKNNHFQYYFKTDHLMQLILSDKYKEERKKFDGWLEDISKRIKEQRKNQDSAMQTRRKYTPFIYDILVAPIHETNAMFIKVVNEKVFNKVPMVIYIDSDREYRENILSKYSNLTALYYNILNTGRNAIINFYYIDDAINSGTAFRRTYSLLRTLFPDKAFEENASVKVSLFQDIIILLNRNSQDTMKDYVEKDRYFSYFNLSVSSLRNHHKNACALCADVSNYKILKERSSLGNMSLYFEDIINDKKAKSVDVIIEQSGNQDRYFRRLICTNEINEHLSKLGWEKNNPKEVRKVINSLIVARLKDNQLDENEKLEYLMSYFYVLSRPYLSYRKSIIDVTFPILLEKMEALLNNKIIPFSDEIKYINDAELISSDKLKDLFRVMINCLARLDASYLIRVNVLNKIFGFATDIGFEENDFAMLLGAAIKRITTLGKDESVCLWLEHLLVLEYEYGNKNEILRVDSKFKDFLFYENTYIIADAVDELVFKDISSVEDVDRYIGEYYFDNFVKLINVDYFGRLKYDIPQNNEGEMEIWNNVKENLFNMVELKKLLKKDNEETQYGYYYEIIKYIKKITKAEYVYIYGKGVSEKIYIIGSSDRSYYCANDLLEMDNSQREINNYLEKSIYFYDKSTVLILLTEHNKDSILNNEDAVWLVLKFGSESIENKGIECKIAIRNILANKYLLTKRIKTDFKKNTFNQMKELSIKNELLSRSKAGSHTPDAALEQIYRNLSEIEGSEDNIYKWAGQLLQIASDSLISKLYVESIREEENNTEKTQGRKPIILFDRFQFGYEQIKLFEKIFYVHNDKCENEPTYAKLYVEKDVKELYWLFPERKYYYNLFIIAALIQNAVKYGRAENGVVNIKIWKNSRDLIIENELKEGYCKEDENDGITISALNHYFTNNLEKSIEIEVEEIDKILKMYRVKIPMIYEGEIYE